MHDFRCTQAEDMYYDVPADRVRYLKETEEGARTMSEAMESLVRDLANDLAKDLAKEAEKRGMERGREEGKTGSRRGKDRSGCRDAAGQTALGDDRTHIEVPPCTSAGTRQSTQLAIVKNKDAVAHESCATASLLCALLYHLAQKPLQFFGVCTIATAQKRAGVETPALLKNNMDFPGSSTSTDRALRASCLRRRRCR